MSGPVVTWVLERLLTETIISDVKRQVGEVVKNTAEEILSDASASMEGIKHGRTYTRKGITHTASAPGEPPAIDTGALKGSGYAERVTDLEWEVGYRADYAEVLEGTQGLYEQGGILDMMEAMGVFDAMPVGARAPRPFLRPAVTANADNFYAAMQRILG